jgi:hypothetical protein
MNAHDITNNQIRSMTTNKLIIEAGKFYRTRDGRKARIYATDGQSPLSIHGAIALDVGWNTFRWEKNGSYYEGSEESQNDLIAEWIDKPQIDWSVMPEGAVAVAMDGKGTWRAFPDKVPVKVGNGWVRAGAMKLYPNHRPKWTGDWKDSLVIKPGHEQV